MSYNRLSAETSPYLLQHENNPVHWRPWGEEAFRAAREKNRPVLLSIGYSACHWCHVMAHESFEDEETAELMNAHFINVKVDREERPDIDRYFMRALRAMGQGGGWPLTMFLTPDGTPFWGGTYFPPTPRHGLPSFRQVLAQIARLWESQDPQLPRNAKEIAERLRRESRLPRPAGKPPAEFPLRAARAIADHCDPRRGGLRGAPKFPQCPVLELLWNAGIAAPVLTTLTNMCQGGLYDHLGGGFSRYSVDENWRVPHFEKMLYDNAQILSLLARAWSRTGNDLFRERIEETVDFLRADLHVPGRGLASSLDADSEGREGAFYIWTYRELKEVIPEENRKLFFAAYGVTRKGNFEGANILHRLDGRKTTPEEEAALRRIRKDLLRRRRRRVPPARDDKILAAWNGLAIQALVDAALLLDRPDWLAWAAELFHDVARLLRDGGGLRQSWLESPSRAPAAADGMAKMIRAAISLHEATAETSFLKRAGVWTDHMMRHYLDEESGAFRFTHESISGPHGKQVFAEDEATPNHNAVMIENLRALAFMEDNPARAEQAERIIGRFAMTAAASPLPHAAFLKALRNQEEIIQASVFHPRDSRETEDSRETFSLLRALVKQTPIPLDIRHVFADDAKTASFDPPLKKPALVLCRRRTCSRLLREPEEIAGALRLLK